MTAPSTPQQRMISIAGHVGSGKSTVARIIAERTGMDLFSTGGVFRRLADRLGMTVLELNEYARGHPEVDDEVDGHLRRLADDPRPLVIDSRMAWFFVPDSFKVFIVVDAAEGARRVYGAGRHDEHHDSIDAAREKGKTRERVEARRYLALYGVVRDDWRNYDLIVDSTHAPAEAVADAVLSSVASPPPIPPRCMLSPRRLLPSRARGTDFAVGPTSDISVAVCDGFPVIVAGHGTVMAAIEGGRSLVECRLAAYGRPPSRSGVTPAKVRAWEAANGFSFDTLPAWARPEEEG